jgi:hypothetical protein
MYPSVEVIKILTGHCVHEHLPLISWTPRKAHTVIKLPINEEIFGEAGLAESRRRIHYSGGDEEACEGREGEKAIGPPRAAK